MDVQWLSHCHGCREPVRACKYCQLFSVFEVIEVLWEGRTRAKKLQAKAWEALIR